MISLTISGADDNVDRYEMIVLSDEFQFLEWGILMSTKRAGTPRYPSESWISRLSVLGGRGPVRFAAHLCGQLARDTAAGKFDEDWLEIFERFQINRYTSDYAGPVTILSLEYPVEFILQCQHIEDLQPFATQTILMGRASVLFDASGGRGKEPPQWPSWPVAPSQTKVGFAGGIGPGNVEAVIGEIIAANPTIQDFWIDMESGVRTDDRLDLGKVRSVCRKVAEINRRIGA